MILRYALDLAVSGHVEVVDTVLAVLVVGTKTTLGEGLHESTLVLAVGEGLVGIDDGITGLHEVGVAWHEGHSVEDQLHGKIAAVRWSTVDKFGHDVLAHAVLIDQVPQDFVEDGGPDGTNAVDLVHALHISISVGVGLHVGRVWVFTDTALHVGSPFTHGVVGVVGVTLLETDGSGVEVTPALTHTTGLELIKAVGVGRTTAETVG